MGENNLIDPALVFDTQKYEHTKKTVPVTLHFVSREITGFRNHEMDLF